jgi:sugar O-acyltransferase (sialic acid O-acetyltransferase NeuD family)
LSAVVLFGTGDFARVARAYLRDDSPHEVVAFTVHERYVDQGELDGIPVVPFERLEETHPPASHSMFVALGFSGVNRRRAELYAEAKGRGYELLTYVSSRADVSNDVQLGDNCFVFEANVIQPFVRIGDDVVIWSGNHIGHHSTIDDHCFIASHAVISGNVTIGAYAFIGVNATLRDGVTVAPASVVGAGALIMKDTEEGDVYSTRGTDPRPVKSWDLEGF